MSGISCIQQDLEKINPLPPKKERKKQKKKHACTSFEAASFQSSIHGMGGPKAICFAQTTCNRGNTAARVLHTSTVDLECTDIYNCRHHFATIHMHAAYSIIIADEFDRSRRKITNWWGHKATSSPLARPQCASFFFLEGVEGGQKIGLWNPWLFAGSRGTKSMSIHTSRCMSVPVPLVIPESSLLGSHSTNPWGRATS